MKTPELVLVAGPNAAGKSSFIRTRIDELQGFEVIMTDVYKSRAKEVRVGPSGDYSFNLSISFSVNLK